MATVFEKIAGDDPIFSSKEYIQDSLIFNTIESARKSQSFTLYSDHRNVVILIAQNGPRVWLWTSSAIKDDTNKLIDICRFLRDCNIPKAEIYLKQDVSGNFSDLYALTTLEINYAVKDEFSLAVYTFNGEKVNDVPTGDLAEGEKIILLDKNNEDHVRMIREFYTQLCDEFRWQDKFDRKVNEYLSMEHYGLVKDGRIIASGVIGSGTDQYLRIKSIAVLQSERRRGYGFRICSYVVGKIKERGLTPVLYTHIGNEAAVALWAKTGFREKDKLYLLKIENSDE